METLWRWVIGSVVSLIIGQFVTRTFVDRVRSHFKISEQWIATNFDFGLPNLPCYLTGTLERVFFTILIAFDVSGVSTGMMTWLLIKVVSNWNLIYPQNRGSIKGHDSDEDQSDKDQRYKAQLRRFAYSGLLGTLMSMLFALIGGLICRGAIWWWPC